MCGRFAFSESKELYEQFDIDEPIEELVPNYNASPLQSLPVIIQNSPNKIELMQWGLVPSWSKTTKYANKTFNARAETIDELPTFRNSFVSKRCIVPVNGFYEWKKNKVEKEIDDKWKDEFELKEKRSKLEKTPYFIRPKIKGYFALAGLYDRWVDKKTGEILSSFTIITTTPTKGISFIHNRMPVILDEMDYNVWLNPQNKDKERLKLLLNPYEDDLITMYPVSNEVNYSRNNHKGLYKPVVNSL